MRHLINKMYRVASAFLVGSYLNDFTIARDLEKNEAYALVEYLTTGVQEEKS